MKPLTIAVLAALVTTLCASDARAQSTAEKVYQELAALPATER